MTRVLWFHPRFPWPVRHGGDLRTTGLVDCARSAGHEILLVTPAGDPGLVPDGVGHVGITGHRGLRLASAKLLSRHPLRSPRATVEDLRAVRRAVAAWHPDVAVVSEVMAWSIAADVVPARLPVVYDSPNVESRLFRELARGADGADRLTLGLDARRVRSDERRLLSRAEVVLAASADDARDLRDLGAVRVEEVANSVPTPAVAADPGASGPVVLFVGTLDYPPNRDASLELVRQVLPRVREEVDARLVVVGRRAVRGLREEVGRAPWADLREDVVDLAAQYHAARVVVLPIRAGSGTNLKTLEALAHGVPVVATPLAMRGMRAAPALVTERPEELAALAVGLLRDPERARLLGAAGRDHFVEHLSWSSGPTRALTEALRAAAGEPG